MKNLPLIISKIENFFSLEANQLIILLIILLAFYGNTVFNGFVHDDRAEIVKNKYLHSGEYWGKIFTGCTRELQLEGCWGKGFYYRPIKIASNFVAYRISSSPWIFHLFNIVYVYILAVLLLRFYTFFLKNKITAFCSVLLFLTHPINTEVVNWISASQETLMAIFALLSFQYYLKYHTERKSGHLLISSLFFLGTMFSKETGVFLILVFLGYELFQKRPLDIFRALIKNYRLILFYVIPILIYFFSRYLVLGTFFTNDILRNTRDISFATHLQTSVWLFGAYFSKLFLPLPLNIFHSIDISKLPVQGILFSVLLLFSFLVALFFSFRKKEIVPFLGLLWWLTFISVPVIFIGALGRNILAERYLFVPSVGIILVFTYVIQRWMDKIRQ